MTVSLAASSSCASTTSTTPPHLATDLNKGRSALAHLDFEGEVPFGPAMKVRRYRMGNGLRVLVLIDRGAPVVSYHTWFRVGSRDEKVGKTGLAHLFEHLMFNETKNLAAGEFDRTLEENGAESNAATWLDWTMYHESLPAPKLGLAVKIEADRMANLVLRDKQVSSEKEVVANERRYRVDDDVEGSVSEILWQTAFEKHPYHWPTIGWMRDIEGFTTEDCEAFYKTFYAPNNATVVVVGDVVETDALKLVQDHYGALPASKLPERKLPIEAEQTAERRVEVKKPTATEKLMIGYKSTSLSHPDHIVLTVLNEILFGGRSSRVYRSLVKQQEVASDLRGWVGTFADPGLYEMYLTAREQHSANDLEAALKTELTKLREHEVATEELEKAKSRLELGFLQGMETVSGKAEQIGFYETVLGDPGAAFARLDGYRKVTAADVIRVARTYLVDARRTVIHILPDGSAGTDGPSSAESEGGDEHEVTTDGSMAHKLAHQMTHAPFMTSSRRTGGRSGAQGGASR
ncbi:MAG: pitrilysin family protein [Polyangiales bacterium]